ncbi:sodium:solute symporter family protein [Cardinium endosymbiont of Culicoides punctatus]|uniref:sodium:solute symporter family protein n=1 Tax=Cardinium endosymbiont of Culicoides punctatus TaxID=2304601 RepID=UPI00105913A7|nr:sodium:solute symporter family protein [Cardinium endosymbiont of Culicoides punctatus]TDG95044.1 hypothetical protein CCPUN_06300 [Cardinium endosymbiont of Culicoides punctatus]
MYTIDLIIIGIFLAISLTIGLYYSKGITTFKDYAVGGGNMSTLVITISLIATTYAGGILNSRLDGYYRQGIYMLIMDLASPVSFYLASRFIIIRMKEFIGDLSIAESMGKLYGTSVRMITAVMGIIMTIAILAVQFKVGLLIVTSLFSISKQYAEYYTIALALLVIIYTTLGGARSVSVTDVYQFCLFSVCFPILIFTLLYNSKDLLVNWQKFMTMPQFNLLKVCTWNDALVSVLTNFIWHSVFPFDPARIQRVYMTSVQQAAKVFFKSAMIRVFFPLLFFSIAGALYMGGHKISSHQSVLNYIIHLQYFPGMKGILITAIIALLMSTADSNLHAASVLFTNDIYPIVSRFNASSYKLSLKVAQISSGIIGILALFIVLYTTSVIQLMNKAVHFYVPAIAIPMIMACFGFRPRPAAVLWTMGISIALTTYRIFIQGQSVGQKDIFYSLLCSTFILIITNYLLPRKPNTGWVGIPDDNTVQLQNQETKRWWSSKIKTFQAVCTKSYWDNIFPRSSTTFIASGIYFIIYSSILLCYMNQVYGLSYIYWYIVIMFIGTIVTFYPTFHAYKKGGNRFLHGLWPILLCVAFFISGITYMKLSHFSPISCAFFIVNIGLSSLLLPYNIMIFMLFTSLFIHKWIPPYISLIGCKELITIETMMGLTILLSCLVYRYLRNENHIKLQTIALIRIYEQQYALASLHNQANWNRLDPTYSGKVLQDMTDLLNPYVENLPIQEFQNKLYIFTQSLLKRAKEERTFTLSPQSIHKVYIEELILKSYEMVRKLDIPIQLLLKKQTKEKYLLTESITFERLLTINFWWWYKYMILNYSN